LPRVAVRARCTFELLRGTHVEQREPSLVHPGAQLRERYVFHWLRKSRSTSLKRSG
jgi:hypothetical protein